ncbi:site-2 protease family protein [Metabacillus litoralis]|uniref:site-2 protease family protein n=1 Tax=Metabacillus litoralis TaxID=152268 RepID=UPI002041CEFA|nr:site-2 protease family protein [Metabacillus litoralis]MCM3412645.1 site-2 protease family protein [Metabacillus litoralis]
MTNEIVILLLMLLFILCFFRMIKSSVDLTVTMKRKSIDDDNRFKLMDKYQARMFNNILNIFIISGCIAFLFENQITSKLIINLMIAYVTLNFIICMHEFGHYFFGKRYGLKIEAFNVGIGNTLFKTKIKETTFTLKLIPFLGFVKPADTEQFNRLRRGQKILFFSGGLFVNYFFYVLGVVMIAVDKGHSVVYGIKTSFTLLWTIVLKIIDSFTLDIIYSPNASIEGQVQEMLGMSDIFSEFWIGFAIINLLFFVFNLLPIAPLDGGHIFKELMEKTLRILRIPKKIITLITTIFVLVGLIFFGSRIVVNNGWDMLNDLQGRWLEFTLWLMLLFTVVGYFTQRKLDKIKP